MLIFHKFVDVLRGASHECPLRILDGIPPEHIKTVCEALLDAEKFDFGQLPLEPDPDEPLQFRFPGLTKDERQAWSEGLVPLPAPISWFEFKLGSSRSGLLILDLGGEWLVTRLDWTPETFLLYDGHAVSIRMDDVGPVGMISVRVTGPPAVTQAATSNAPIAGPAYRMTPMMAIYMTLMLLSSSTEVVSQHAPKNLNKGRIKKGRTPLADHHVVTIVPERFLRASRSEAGSTRRPPRLHSRRSHVRTLHRGEANERRILIPRCWVMLGSDAEVSHEYRIGPNRS